MKEKRFLPDGWAVYGGLALLLLLGLGAFVFRQDFSFWEKRYLAEPPKNYSPVEWTLNSDLETYLSDQLPFRRVFVALDAQAQALTGRAVQLGAWPTGDAIVEKPVETDADTLLRRVAALRGFAGDTPCRFLTPPTAGMLKMGEMTAARRAVYELEAETYDTLARQEDFIPLREAFENSEEVVYYRTDHHWTLEGAYLAYRAYCSSAGLEPLEKDNFEISDCGAFLGTTYTRSGLPFARADTLICAEPKTPVTVRFDGEAYDHLIFPEEAQTYDGYAVYLKGNHGLLTVENLAGERGTLFICKDSYANSLIPFLSAHYRRIVAVDARYYTGTFADALAEAGDAEEILFLYSMDSLANDTAVTRKLRAR
ncbi:MAG: hypothetical protein K5919_00870 [Clostridiales bacterium]|nr:hypothetical protein [Clostridiales bacterium]